eukprot:GHVL01023584.1.p1 GENE.GHVL01023584.1~~GHVL01023584.1.p1  ORF type:complete len:582 (+),score=71.30 GHVL01023584.1:93-1838(+)
MWTQEEMDAALINAGIDTSLPHDPPVAMTTRKTKKATNISSMIPNTTFERGRTRNRDTSESIATSLASVDRGITYDDLISPARKSIPKVKNNPSTTSPRRRKDPLLMTPTQIEPTSIETAQTTPRKTKPSKPPSIRTAPPNQPDHSHLSTSAPRRTIQDGMDQAKIREEKKQKALQEPTQNASESESDPSSEDSEEDNRTMDKIKAIRKLIMGYQAVMRRIEAKNGVPADSIHKRNQISIQEFEDREEYNEARQNVRRLLKKSIDLSLSANPHRDILEYPEIFNSDDDMMNKMIPLGESPEIDLQNAVKANLGRWYADDGLRVKHGKHPRVCPKADEMAANVQIQPPSDPSQFGEIGPLVDDNGQDCQFAKSFFKSTVLIKKNREVTTDDLKKYYAEFPDLGDFTTQEEYAKAYFKHLRQNIPAYLAQYPKVFLKWLRPKTEALDERNSDAWFNLRAAAIHREDLETAQGSDVLTLQVQNLIAADALRFRQEHNAKEEKAKKSAAEREVERKQVIGVTRLPRELANAVPPTARHICYRCGKGGHAKIDCRSTADVNRNKLSPRPRRRQGGGDNNAPNASGN